MHQNTGAYVLLDTSVLIHDPTCLGGYPHQTIILPVAVLEELDNLIKEGRRKPLAAQSARAVRDELYRLLPRMEKTDPAGDVPGIAPLECSLDNGGRLRIEMNHVSTGNLPSAFDPHKADNRILAMAMNLSKELSPGRLVLLTMDITLLSKAMALGVHATSYDKGRVDLKNLYQGYQWVTCEPDLMEAVKRDAVRKLIVSEGEANPDDYARLVGDDAWMPSGIRLYPSGYYILRNGADLKGTMPVRYNGVTGKFERLHDLPLYGLTPRHGNLEQRLLHDALWRDENRIVFTWGSAGTGKTLYALAAALEMTMEQGIYDRIVVVRPRALVGGTSQEYGFYTGSKRQKLSEHLGGVWDNLWALWRSKQGAASRISEERDRSRTRRERSRTGAFGEKPSTMREEFRATIEMFMDTGFLELESLGDVQGRSIDNAIIIVEEAQNLTPFELKMLLQRKSASSRMFIGGDIENQVIRPFLDAEYSGLAVAIEHYAQFPFAAIVQLRDFERSPEMAAAASMPIRPSY